MTTQYTVGFRAPVLPYPPKEYNEEYIIHLMRYYVCTLTK